MAFRPLLRRRAVIPATAAALAASTIFFPLTTLHAEAPPSVLPPKRKPIYSDPPPPARTPTSTPPPPPDATYTARLATQIRRARLTLHTQTTSLETRLNTLLTSLLSLETSVTSTLASLAPPPDSHEKLIPGAIYVLVAAMAGSIAARNRNVLLRASVPAAVGVAAGWVVLPGTMRNVGDLVWGFEERVPVVAENHLRVRGAVEEGWRQVGVHGEVVRRWAEERVREGREVVEGWVRKGG